MWVLLEKVKEHLQFHYFLSYMKLYFILHVRIIYFKLVLLTRFNRKVLNIIFGNTIMYILLILSILFANTYCADQNNNDDNADRNASEILL